MFGKTDKISDIIWSPFNKDEFIAYGNDFYLYRLNNSKPKSADFPASDECVAELLATFGENTNPRVIAWYNGIEAEYLYAVSFQNQKIQIINMNNSTTSVKTLEIRKELTFKQSRQCTNLVWNPLRPNYLAAGFERLRVENSIIVWDLNSTVDMNGDPVVVFSSSQTETCNALAWFPYDKHLMMAGVNNNSIKYYDIRVSKAALHINTKFVNNICIDPFSYTAASFYENQIALWDTRYQRKGISEPLEIIDTSGPISKIQWCQKRTGKLACLRKNSNDIITYSIKPVQNVSEKTALTDDSDTIEDEMQRIIDEKLQTRVFKIDRVCVGSSSNSSGLNTCLKSFCWNNCDASKILVVDNAIPNQNFKILSLIELSAMEWSPNGDFSWVATYSRINQTDRFYECDFSREFKEKTKYNYGLKYDQSANGLITCDFQHNVKLCRYDVAYLWQWLDSVNRLFDFHAKNQFNQYFLLRYSGLRNLLDEFVSKKHTTSSEKYDSYEKFKTITFNLCDWNYKDGMMTREFFNKLDQSGQFERAICLAIILNYSNYTDLMDVAIKRDTRFGYIWVALKCLLDENKEKIDKETRQEYEKLSREFTNPYLQALFNYILFKEEAIQSILNDKNILFQDRIALSVYFLLHKEAELIKYFDSAIEECVNNVNINGILLTGLSTRCINLLQAYIDKTSDIQTIALVIIHSTFDEVSKNKQVKHWIDCYRELLNKLRLWEIRAIYDNLHQKIMKSNHHIQSILSQLNSNVRTLAASHNFNYSLLNTQQKYASISLLCNYCGKNVLERVQNRLITLSQQTTSASSGSLNLARLNMDVIQGCFECAKFLPQCVICLKFMSINPSTLISAHGTSAAAAASSSSSSTHRQSLTNNQSPKITSLSSTSIAGTGGHHSHSSTAADDNYSFLIHTKFGNAFSWCVNCKHGGHIKHLAEWFSIHTKCPFPHCKCNCLQMDTI